MQFIELSFYESIYKTIEETTFIIDPNSIFNL